MTKKATKDARLEYIKKVENAVDNSIINKLEIEFKTLPKNLSLNGVMTKKDSKGNAHSIAWLTLMGPKAVGCNGKPYKKYYNYLYIPAKANESASSDYIKYQSKSLDMLENPFNVLSFQLMIQDKSMYIQRDNATLETMLKKVFEGTNYKEVPSKDAHYICYSDEQ